jgi:hypothetical protein
VQSESLQSNLKTLPWAGSTADLRYRRRPEHKLVQERRFL